MVKIINGEKNSDQDFNKNYGTYLFHMILNNQKFPPNKIKQHTVIEFLNK